MCHSSLSTELLGVKGDEGKNEEISLWMIKRTVFFVSKKRCVQPSSQEKVPEGS